jgi:hypothetical protein
MKAVFLAFYVLPNSSLLTTYKFVFSPYWRFLPTSCADAQSLLLAQYMIHQGSSPADLPPSCHPSDLYIILYSAGFPRTQAQGVACYSCPRNQRLDGTGKTRFAGSLQPHPVALQISTSSHPGASCLKYLEGSLHSWVLGLSSALWCGTMDEV